MSTTTKQDQGFLNDVFGSGMLEASIEWIKGNIAPEEVFGEKELLSWASNYDPDSIFPQSALESWAEANGYTKE